MNIADALRRGVATLHLADVPDPMRDARWLLSDLLQLDAAVLLAHDDRQMTATEAAAFEARIADRAAGKPVAKITGRKAFYGSVFMVSEDVLDPRPETELLIELALKHAPTVATPRILDIGTGSGCILLTMLATWLHATGTGTDASPDALKIARANAEAMDNDRARFLEANWWPDDDGYDLILSNPPYISEAEMEALSRDVRDWDPRIALTPGGDGLAAYRAIASGVATVAKPGATLIVEIGAAQKSDVSAILSAAGLTNIRCHPDLNGLDRAITATI